MSRRGLGLRLAAAVGASVFALAFFVAPRSCDGGLELYAGFGVAALAALVIIPFATHMGDSRLPAAVWSLVLAAFGLALWLAGAFAADVRILCRLF